MAFSWGNFSLAEETSERADGSPAPPADEAEALDPFAAPPTVDDELPAEPPAAAVVAPQPAIDNAAEAKIRHALTTDTTLEFVETELSTVLRFLEDLHEIQIVLDEPSLEDAGISSKTLVTQDLRELSLQSALELMLEKLGATWVIRQGCLIITTEQASYSTQVYHVSDLLTKTDDGKSDYNALVGALESTILPESWSVNGGSGQIVPYAGTLIVYQSAPVHRQVERLLTELRKVAKLDFMPAEPAASASSTRGRFGGAAKTGGGQF